MNKFYIGAIIALILVIFLQRACSPKPKDKIASRVDTFYVHINDTVIEHVPVPLKVLVEGKPVLLKSTDTIIRYEFITEAVDTVAILRDFFATRYYSDTNRVQYGDIVVEDSVTQNKIKFRRVLTNFSIPQVHQEIIKPVNQFWFGLSAGSNGQTIGIGPEILLKTKLDKMYTGGITLFPNSPIYYHVGLYWKLHL